MSNKYFAINIGPVAKTIGLARKPRELWLASYIFSYLAKHIISILKRENCTLLSPATFDKPYGIGLYPDRIFFNSEKDSSDILGYIETAWEQFNQGLGFDRSYFNIMLSECMASSHSEAIQTLNKKSDLLELSNFAQDDDSIQKVYDMITASTSNSSRILYKDAGFEGKMPVETLAEISAVSLSGTNADYWKEFCKAVNDDYIDYDPFKRLKGCKSHHKYYCIVQADGDKMGDKIQSLKDDDLHNFSASLLQFGIEAKSKIEEYGGLPVYAGGDDLLFIAPVAGLNNRNIFGLIEDLSRSFSIVGSDVSLSFGICITYYKHPLYEGLESSYNLLRKAKDFIPKGGSDKIKNTIAVTLEKHSGESFDLIFSKNIPEMWKKIEGIINNNVEDKAVSAVAHKLRSTYVLLNSILNDTSNRSIRLKAYFKNILETSENGYFTSVRNLIPVLYDNIHEELFNDILYGALRIAKFIQGEDIK